MQCIAHRGFATVHPENTVPAVRTAAATADWVEVDVRRCGSGEPVVIHDATVDRVTDASGTVADMTAAALGNLSVEGDQAGVPTFEAVVDAIPAEVGIDAECKEVAVAVDVVERLGTAPNPSVVTAFDDATLTAARDAGADRLGLLARDAEGAIARADRLDCDVLALHHEAVDADLVARAKRAGVSVWAWTVRDGETARSVASVGADGVIADAPRFCPGRL